MDRRDGGERAPMVVFATRLTADKIAAGGWLLLRRSAWALAIGFLLAWAALGFPFEPHASQRTLRVDAG